MENFAKIEYKSVSEINKHFEVVLAKRFGVSDCNVDIYDAISPALKRLERDGFVDAKENPEHAKWKLYKYIG
jgi:hypothetical protein